ncbi:matrixin family metalloprotease [Actinocorallia populi]|uniref:matrixin family metalloprotease n=1 Tax=Actinocorallia populi TaxID=2079200 RepID=UPI000D096AFA|nr:matrixin family metalloprotease [Actinocorallia populi]
MSPRTRRRRRPPRTPPATTADARKVACHELGHTVGLRHNSSKGTCMYQAPAAADSATLTSTERSEINGNYS